ncbi:MAG: thioredoxin family protein [Pseudomonadota bacterium]
MSKIFPVAFAAFAGIAAFAVAGHAATLNVQPYSDAAFAAAQKANRKIIVEVHAPWCPVCAAQGRALAKLSENPANRDIIIFRIDFDTQKPLWQKFGAQKQSTLIAFRGKRETGRIVYVADEASVAKLLASVNG